MLASVVWWPSCCLRQKRQPLPFRVSFLIRCCPPASKSSDFAGTKPEARTQQRQALAHNRGWPFTQQWLALAHNRGRPSHTTEAGPRTQQRQALTHNSGWPSHTTEAGPRTQQRLALAHNRGRPLHTTEAGCQSPWSRHRSELQQQVDRLAAVLQAFMQEVQESIDTSTLSCPNSENVDHGRDAGGDPGVHALSSPATHVHPACDSMAGQSFHLQCCIGSRCLFISNKVM